MTDQMHESFPEPSDAEDHSDHESSEEASTITPSLMSDRPGANNMIRTMASRSDHAAYQRTMSAYGQSDKNAP